MTRKKSQNQDLTAEIDLLRQSIAELKDDLTDTSETDVQARVKTLELVSRVCVRLSMLLKAQSQLQGAGEHSELFALLDEAITEFEKQGRSDGTQQAG